MALDERQLGVILQACVDRAREMLEEAGGFLPFGARARIDGGVEFLEPEGLAENETLEELYKRIGAILADEADRSEILAAALVVNAALPGLESQNAIAVQVEAPEFCRAIIVPYRLAGNGGGPTVEFGSMIPEEADPIVFA